MKFSEALALSAAASLFGATAVSASTSSFCPKNFQGACYQWGVPEASSKAGSGDIYFQLKAPTSHQWLGLGIGTQMKGAQIFLMYQDGNGNVTLSTRAGKGEFMPLYTPMSDVELLEGSGVVNGSMVANVRCGSCNSLDLTSETNWIAAWRSGDPIDNTSPSATISEHDVHTTLKVNLGGASIASNSNPFLSDSASKGSSSGAISSSDSGSDSGDDGDDSNTLPYAHGIIMTVVFVFAYPVGAMFMPAIGKWWFHASWQMLAFLAMWAGFGIGYIASRNQDIFFDQAHTRLGVIVVALMGIQPLLGWGHHVLCRKHGKRTVISYIHIWYGRCLMILGIVNGGLGLQLAAGPKSWIIAYSVVGGLVALLYAAACVLKDLRGSSRTGEGNSRQKGHNGGGDNESPNTPPE